jgi:hypothetical protein
MVSEILPVPFPSGWQPINQQHSQCCRYKINRAVQGRGGNMKKHLSFVFVVVAVFGIGLTSAANDEPVIKRSGKTQIRYSSKDLKAEFGYHWANRHLGDEILLLKLAVTGGRGAVTKINRESVRLRTPDGHTLILPTQTEFRRMYGSIRMGLQQDNSWQPPSSRFASSLTRSEEWFFAPPGETFNRNNVYPSAHQYASGPLVFQVPGGVQPGGWMLFIDLEETTIKIPFVLGEQGQ